MLRIEVRTEDGSVEQVICCFGYCLQSPREQALEWLHEHGFAYTETMREGERTWDEYKDVRTNLFTAILEEA